MLKHIVTVIGSCIEGANQARTQQAHYINKEKESCLSFTGRDHIAIEELIEIPLDVLEIAGLAEKLQHLEGKSRWINADHS
jgi:hypothetical protein